MSRESTSALAASVLLSMLPSLLAAQQVERSVSIVSSDVASQVSAFSYVEGPESKLTFRGTSLTPAAEGKVDVEYQQGRSKVDAEVKRLPDPWALGPYTTYVLWAVTPDGRSTNLGVMETSDGRGDLKTSFSGSQFALVVTAEPHFAVTSPSTAIVLINVAERVKGTQTKVTSLAERADYAGLAPIGIDKKTAPVDLVAARYAVAIAAAAGAEQYADAAFKQAQDKLQAAETAQASKKSSVRRTAPKLSREAVQAGASPRLVAAGRRPRQCGEHQLDHGPDGGAWAAGLWNGQGRPVAHDPPAGRGPRATGAGQRDRSGRGPDRRSEGRAHRRAACPGDRRHPTAPAGQRGPDVAAAAVWLASPAAGFVTGTVIAVDGGAQEPTFPEASPTCRDFQADPSE